MKKLKYGGFILTALVVLFYLGCEGFEEETFEFSELESAAATLMQDTLVIDLILPIINDFVHLLIMPLRRLWHVQKKIKNL